MNIDEPLFTSEMHRSDFALPSGATIICGTTDSEERGRIARDWVANLEAGGGSVARISEDVDVIVIEDGPHSGSELSVYDVDMLAEWLKDLPQPVYLDITALAHASWAPIVRAAVLHDLEFQVVYIEPSEYRRSEVGISEQIYDLSEKIGGVAPLPGFVSLDAKGDGDAYFIPLVGFEGLRLEHIVSKLEVGVETTFPVIGIPGFRPEYSFYAYDGNRHAFEQSYLANNVQFAKANCPFELFQLLVEMRSWFPNSFLRIALVGTKPHALGAVLFAISRGDIELIYDHPVRAKRRTIGESRLCVYDIANFCRTPYFARSETRSIEKS